MLPLNFDNFFPHLINHPDDAIEGNDRKWAWVASVILGIFTVGTVHAGCALYEWLFSPKNKEELNPTENKIEGERRKQRLGEEANKIPASIQQKEVQQNVQKAHETDLVLPKSHVETNPLTLPPQTAPQIATPPLPLQASPKPSVQELEKNQPATLPKDFDLVTFKEKALACMQTGTLEQSSLDLSQVVLTEKHWKIIQKRHHIAIKKEEEDGHLKILDWGDHWALIEFPDLPSVVLKIACKLLNQ